MNKPVLVVLAAGMGSRYHGLKQIDPMGKYGEKILDYSVYDAKRAGFETVVFVIKPQMEQEFEEQVGKRMRRFVQVKYAFQTLDALPQGFTVPQGREKPWGTAHAVLCAAECIDAPFAVINADDYYGPSGYQLLFDLLSSDADSCAMVAYPLASTVTENGHVSRGICRVSAEGLLQHYTNIPIDYLNEERLEEEGLVVANSQNPVMAKVVLQGRRADLLAVKSSDIAATVDVSQYTKGDNYADVEIHA